MPEQVLYGVISFLGLAVITLLGVWVHAKDRHQQWATEQITAMSTLVAVLHKSHEDTKSDITEIKDTLKEHTQKEEKFQRILLLKLGIKDVD